MQWTDDAIVLSSRAHGENHTVTTLFTRAHGARAALVHGGQGRRMWAVLQPGNRVAVDWQVRREDELGSFTLEMETAHSAGAMANRLALLGLGAVTELLCRALPEGNAYPELFAATDAMLSHLHDETIFPVLMVHWEMGVLSALGYGLTLEKCAATGALLEDGADLTFVSPKSGGAVTLEAGLPYQDKLLPLPAFLIGRGEPTYPELMAAYKITGHFLQNWLLAPDGGELPQAREQMIRRLGAR